MIKSPEVSVILTSYNHDEFVSESITSVLNQTFTDFELIVWDDCSTDESWQIISKFSDPRLRAFRNKKNLGGGGSRNIRKAIEEGVAKGKYIAIHHSDDVWKENKLEKQVAYLKSHPEIGAVFTWAQIIDQEGNLFQDENHFYNKIFEQDNRTRHEWLNHFFYEGNALCHPSVLIRRSCYDDVGLYRIGMSQLADFDMWVRLCLEHEIHVIPEKLVQFRLFDDERNVSGNRQITRIRISFDFYQVYKNFCNLESPNEFLKIFPQAEQYLKPEGIDLYFALGMLALEHYQKPAKLVGLQLLFEALNDPIRSKNIQELYDFSIRDFMVLNTKTDVFSVEISENFLETKKQLAVTRSQLTELLNSKPYKTALVLQRLRRFFAPENSLRERLLQGLERLFLSGSFVVSKQRKMKNDKELVSSSGLFDRAWYLSKNPDVGEEEIDPLEHYLVCGGFEGRDPSSKFSSQHYLETYFDVSVSGINPLVHYLRNGQKEDRTISTPKEFLEEQARR